MRPHPGTEPRGRWTALALLSVALLLGMGEWFTATAVGPALQLRWGLGDAQLSLLTTLVQLGFVAGTLDRKSTRLNSSHYS